MPGGSKARRDVFEAGPRPHFARAWGIVCGISTGSQGATARLVCHDGRLWRLRAMVYRHGHRVRAGWLRNRTTLLERRPGSRRCADGRDPKTASELIAKNVIPVSLEIL